MLLSPPAAPVRRPPPARPSAGRALLRASVALLTVGLAACRAGHGGDASITVRELRAHVEALTSERLRGRLAGTPGYDSAAAYAARAFERAELAPPGAGSGRGRYYQAIRMVRQRIGAGTALELRAGGSVSRVPYGPRTFLLLGGGDGARAMAMRSPVFVGAGLHAPELGVDDLAGLDLAGRAALVNALPPRGAELSRLPDAVARLYANPGAAQRRRFGDLVQSGAAAILLLPDRWLVDEWEMVSAKQRQLYYHTAEPLPGAEPDLPIPLAMLHADLVDRLFVDQGYHPISHAGRYHTFTLDDIDLRLIVDARPDSFRAANVVGIVRGRDRSLRDEFIVVGAQLDGEGVEGERALPGAQNAAACAALLEAAAATAIRPPRRSVVFVLFAAEAGGRWGSRYFLSRPLGRGRMVAAIDIGHVGAARGEGDGVVAYASRELVPIARAVAAQAPHDALDVHDALSHPGAFKGSAAASFEEARVPVILMAPPSTPYATHDDLKHIDWQRLRNATNLLHALIVETGDARPPAGHKG